MKKRNQQIKEYFDRLRNAQSYLEGFGYAPEYNSAGERYWYNPIKPAGEQVLFIMQSANDRCVIVRGDFFKRTPKVAE